MPRVLNKKDHHDLEARVYSIRNDLANAVYVGRPSEWGNPYILNVDGNRTEVIDLYRGYLLRNRTLLSKVKSLKGKDLICWCAPKACHADVLIQLANEEI